MSKEKVGLSPDQVSEKWNRKMKSAVPDIQRGIDNLQTSPMEKAINSQEKMLTNVTAAIQNGRWAKGLSRVSLAEWKTKTKKKVAERLAGGVDAGMDKRKRFDTYLVSTINTILPEINSMPNMTLQDSGQRMLRFMERMAEKRYKDTI